jgi:hypothetical protein
MGCGQGGLGAIIDVRFRPDLAQVMVFGSPQAVYLKLAYF